MMQGKWICCVALWAALGIGGSMESAMAQAAGHTPGEFSVDATGAATYRIPLQLPPGTAGMQPDLALLYHGRAGNGQLGVGWSLAGLSAITRCAALRDSEGESHAGGVMLASTDRFCLDGQLLRSQSGGAYGAIGTRYLTEVQSFQEATSHGSVAGAPEHFQVSDRAGLKRFYGQTADSRILSVGALGGVPVTWALNRIEDRHGNFISFSYGRDAALGEYWPSEVRWGNRLGHVLGRVVFEFSSTRPDGFNGHGYGRTRQAMTRRLDHIQVYEGTSQAMRRYVLTYRQGEHNRLSYLASLRECAKLGSPCLVATTFEWEPGRTGFELSGVRKAADNASGIRWLDVDGDGRLDAVIRHNGAVRIYFATDSGTAILTSVPAGSHLRFNEAVTLDYDGDGRMDLMVANTQTGNWDVYRSTGRGFSYLQTGRPHHGAHTRHPVAFDITGNGVPELFYKHGDRLHVYLGADQGGFLPTPVNTGWPVRDAQRLMPVQFDGDGRPELFVSHDGCTQPTPGDGGGGGGGDDPRLDPFGLPGPGAPSALDSSSSSANAMTGSSEILSSGASCFDSIGPLKWDPLARTLRRPWSDPGHVYLYDPLPLDINGDGLTDMVSVDSTGKRLLVSVNRGGHMQFAWAGFSDKDRPRALVFDWDQDGRDELLVRGADGRLRALSYRNDQAEYAYTDISVPDGEYFVGDWDGDGLPDLYVLSSGTWRVRRHQGRPAGQLLSIRDGLGAEVQLRYAALPVGLGGPDAVYLGVEAGEPSLFSPRVRNYMGPLQVIESYMADTGIRSATGPRQWIVTRMRYGGAKLNQHGRGFLGFRRVVAHNVNAGLVTENLHFQEFPFTGMVEEVILRMPDTTVLQELDWALWSAWFNEQCAADPANCQPPATFVTVPGPIVHRTRNTVASHVLGGAPAERVRFPYVASSTEEHHEPGHGLYRRTTTTFSLDANGNATTVQARTDNGAHGDVHVVTTQNTWGHTPACPSRLMASTVTMTAPDAGAHGPLTRQRTATFDYDPVHCQLRREIRDAGTAAALTREYAFDAFGNRISERESGQGISPSRTTTMEWDAQGRYLLSVTNPLGHVERSTWHVGHARRLTTTDANGLVTRWAYDDFGRQVRVTAPRTSQFTTTTYSWCAGSCRHPDAVLRIIHTGSGQAHEQSLSVVELDRLGREAARGERNGMGQLAYTVVYHDAIGRPYAQSGPYRPGLDAGACWRVRHFDPIGRVREEFASADAGHCSSASPPAPGASPAGWARTHTQHAGLTTTVTDPAGRQRQHIVNVMDRLRFVREHDGSAWQQTEYRYDGHGNTTWVQAPGGVLTTSTYDTAGRKTAMSDPSMGHWSYAYNAAGELTVQTDAKGATVTMTYDPLGRILTRTEPEGTTTWSYDQVAHGAARGQVTNIAGPHGYVERFWYHGAGGELSASARYIGDTWFWTNFDYNGLGQVSRLRYPSVNCMAPCSSAPADSGRLQVDQHYRHGQLHQVRERRADGTAGTIYWEALEVDTLGSVTRERLGNNLFTQRYVNPATGLVESLVTGGAGQPTAVQDLGMAWDRVGNLVQRADYRVNRREDLGYDGLGRLTSVTLRTATGGLLGSESLAYGPSGNLTRKGPLTNYQYRLPGQPGGPNAVAAVTTPAGARSYSYDANGNLTQVTGPGARMVSWWSFNKPRRLEKDSNNHSEYWYGPGADRALFRQSARINGQLELILYGSSLYERRHAGANIEHTHYIQANGATIATVKRIPTPSTTITLTRYLHKDHLGSVVAITNESGVIVEWLAYDAWGKRRPANTWQTPTPGLFVAAVTLRQGFTLHEHLDHVGLIHMGGRVYDPELGRFLSPDPFVQFPASTQGFNRYAYVGNNPLSYTDPSGYFLKKLGKAVGIGMNLIPGMQLSNVWLHGFVSGFLASGGNAKAGVMGMMSAGIASKVGGFADAQGLGDFSRSALHGITQGAIAKAGGGRFGDGALGAFSGSYLSFIPEAVAGPYGSGGEWAKIGRMTAAAVVGGTASKIGGGKFANGAWSAAFVSRFNHDGWRYREPIEIAWEGFEIDLGGGVSHEVPGIRNDVAAAGQAISQSVDIAKNASIVVGYCGGQGIAVCAEGAVGFRGVDAFVGKGVGWGLRPYVGINFESLRHRGITIRHLGGFGHYSGAVNVSQAGAATSGTLTLGPSPGFGGKVTGYTWNVVSWGWD